jgi:hypothetical protein
MDAGTDATAIHGKLDTKAACGTKQLVQALPFPTEKKPAWPEYDMFVDYGNYAYVFRADMDVKSVIRVTTTLSRRHWRPRTCRR